MILPASLNDQLMLRLTHRVYSHACLLIYCHVVSHTYSQDDSCAYSRACSQVPAVVLAYLPPGTEGEAKGPTQLQLQPYPGPIKYPYLAGWLTMAAQELK